MRRRIIILYFIFIISLLSLGTISIESFDDNMHIQVEIKGAVKQEKVIELNIGQTIKDALDEVILMDNADLDNISLLKPVYRNQIITIPKKQELNKISINSSSIEQLSTIKGISDVLANRIIEYRNQYGCFNSIEEIKNVKGIGNSKFEKIKDYICL